MRLGIGILLVAVLCVECSVASGQQQSADKRHVEQNKQIVGFNCNYTSFEQGMIPLDHSKCKTKRKITKKCENKKRLREICGSQYFFLLKE